MNKFGYQGKLKAQPGQGRQLAQILLQASRLVAQAPGCQLYVVSLDLVDPDLVWVTEVWDSKEQQQNSLKDEAVRSLISTAMPILAGPPKRGLETQVIGGHGVEL